jgi:DeoR family fructose operon transcriptional repressor
VVTNSILCANELKDVSGIEVLLCGGSLRAETLALVGPLAENSFNQICVDKSFIATNGVDVENGLTTPNLIEASTKKKMIDCAEKVILITDHTKIGQVSFAKFADIHEINYLITDSRLYLTTLKNQEFLFAQYDFSPIGKDLISDKRKK